MNLMDVLSTGELQQDQWSLSSQKFGEEGQVTVVGFSGLYNGDTHKIYILKCDKCSQDPELFGEGYFKTVKSSLVKGCLPCGCSKKTLWSEDQHIVICSRKAKELGYTFLGFEGEYRGSKTKIRMLCDDHGVWNTGNIANMVYCGNGCPSCKLVIIGNTTGKSNIKPDEVMISSFLSTGCFSDNTEFWRSERKDKRGNKVFWFMSCPDCGETAEAFTNNLQQGHRPCICNSQRQKEAYINLLRESGNLQIAALKFGIALDSKRRIKRQKVKCLYELETWAVYTFPDVVSCKKAERECLQELECGVVLKRDMPDGWTETTWTYNLDKIIEIYERNGVRNKDD